MQLDRQTEMMKLIVTIHNFANVPKTHTEKSLGQKRGHDWRK